jgi:hypothetical protein
MARINMSKAFNQPLPNGDSVEMRDPEDFYIETFSFPEGVGPPRDHYEVTTFCIAGDIQSGKTWAAHYYAYLCKLLWGDNIDFFKADDIFGTIEAVKLSNKFAHFVLIDDSIKDSMDSRRSMSGGNVSATQKYLIIRHEIDKGNLREDKNGYLILCMVAQMFSAIDKRIRKHLSFVLFKTYDEECEEFIWDPKVLSLLELFKDKSTRCKDRRYRKFGVAVDNMGYITPVVVPSKYHWINFTKIKVSPVLELQINEMVDFLVRNVDLDSDASTIKGYLFLELRRMKKRHKRCEINKSHFTEIISIAKAYKDIEDNTGEGSKSKDEFEFDLIVDKIKLFFEFEGKERAFTVKKIADGTLEDYNKVLRILQNSKEFKLVSIGEYCLKNVDEPMLSNKQIIDKELQQIKE